MSKITQSQRRIWLAAGGVCLLLLVLRMPVSVINWLLPSNVNVVQAHGTLWDGRASALGLEGVVLQQKLRWQFLPKALLAGQLAWQVHSEALDTQNQARLVLGLGGVALEQVEVTFPLEGIFRAIPQVAQWGLGGRATLRSAHLSKRVGAQAELLLDPVFSQLVPSLMPMTTLRAQFSAVADGVTWQISPAGASAIAVNGQGQLAWRGAAHGTVNLNPDEKVRQQLAPLLMQVPATAEGYQIKF
ncbi:type II secretion system protein N [uncultured Deefgea sp.]|uniref:type II secretion system protein N n=1 Tax=uncultured Deefgea sp. TaxID=1304914 RepID=UPI00261E053C|nr:type II secretion system protein N [uncultured Deefgea sp.]